LASAEVFSGPLRFRLRQVSLYKARLVARGFNKKYGADYNETFLPVISHSVLRLLFALAAEMNMSVHHMDVKTAFLNRDLKNVYETARWIFCKRKGKLCT
jgi:hypothetical protein